MREVSNGVAALLLGVYLAGIVRHGNGTTLAIYLAEDRQFLYWLVSTFLVYEVIARSGKLGEALSLLLSLALIINIGPRVFPQVDQFLKRGFQS